MSNTHMWLVTKLGRGGSEDTPKVIAASKDDAKHWITQQDAALEFTGERDTYFAATTGGLVRLARYTAHLMPVAAPANSPEPTEETR